MTRLTIICISLITISFMLTFQSVVAKIDLKTIAGAWLFDEGSGDTVIDSSFNGNDGKFMNGPQRVNGRFSKALEFDGVDDYVEIVSSPSLDPGKGDMTWCAWVKTTATGNRYVYSNYESPTSRVEFRVQDGKIRLYIKSIDGATTYRDSTTTFNDGKWHHIVTAWKGSLETATIDNYIDGVLSNAAYGLQQITKANVVPLGGNDYIGARGGVSDYFDGLIDEVALFNVALGHDDIQTIIKRGLEQISAVDLSGKLATTWGHLKK